MSIHNSGIAALFPKLDELLERTPPALTDLLQLPGLGPRRVELIYDTLGIVRRRGV